MKMMEMMETTEMARVKVVEGIVRVSSLGHSGEYGNGARLVGKMSKSVMHLISIHF